MTDIISLDASTLSTGIENRDLSSRDVVTAFLDRIDAVNPAVNAIVSLRDRDAILKDADNADNSPRKGWLHGMPIAIKDLAATKGLRTTMGSPLFENVIPAKDDLMVARIRAAGAIIIGKTNTPEMGLGSHTFNPIFGATATPYDLARTAGGSSGGAAAALASRMLPVADGSDMMGSLRNPAAFCNTYGLRPTWGLVPSEAKGDVFAHTMATSGPMGRTPADIARLLEIQAGIHPAQPFSRDLTGDMSLTRPAKGTRIGWLGNWDGAYEMENGILDLCTSALTELENLGCDIDPVKAPFPATDIWRAWVDLRAWAVAGAFTPLYKDPKQRNLMKPAMIWEIEHGLTLSAADIHHASLLRSMWFQTTTKLFEKYDTLAMPTAQVWPFPKDWIHPTTINTTKMDTYHRWMEIVIPVSLIGLPSLNIPAGFGANNLPMGLQLAGPLGSDAKLLNLGQRYHEATNWPDKRPPAL